LFLLLTIALLVVVPAWASPLVRLNKNIQVKVAMIITIAESIAKLRGARDPVMTKKTSTASAIRVTMEIAIDPVFLFGDILITCSASISLLCKNFKRRLPSGLLDHLVELAFLDMI
jgi:hypothetical protein